MKEINIHFFKEDIRFRLLHGKELKQWISNVFKANKKSIADINYIFCSDKYLLQLNKQYLQHNYFTDIITFDNTSEPGNVEADIFISIDRIRVNAKSYQTPFNDELHRVIVHGALHLVGMNDKTKAGKSAMRKAEDTWLAKRKF